jgi:hypothetical protein
MDVQPIQPALGPRATEPAGLAPGQRVIATVLALEGNRALLGIGSLHLVARLADPGLSAELAGRERIAVLIRSLTPHQAVLQLLPETPEAPASQPTGLAGRLAELGLPPEAPYPQIAAELLAVGLPLTAERVRTLRALLDALGEWTGEDLRVAARLLALNLPVTPETLALARAAEVGPPLAELLTNLRADLRELAAGLGDDAWRTTIAEALAALQGGAWDIRMDAGQPLPAQVGAWLRAIGTPIERTLALLLLQETLAHLPDEGADRAAALSPYLGLDPALDAAVHACLSETAPQQSAQALTALVNRVASLLGQIGDGGVLPMLGRLRRALRQPPPGLSLPLRAAWARATLRTDVLVRALRWAQLQNTGTPQALTLPLALSGAGDMLAGQLQLIYPGQRHTSKGDEPVAGEDTAYARIIVQAEVADTESVEVDMVLVGHQIDCRVRVLGAGAYGRAEAALPDLIAGLNRLGFTVSAGCEPMPIGRPEGTGSGPFTCDVHI